MTKFPPYVTREGWQPCRYKTASKLGLKYMLLLHEYIFANILAFLSRGKRDAANCEECLPPQRGTELDSLQSSKEQTVLSTRVMIARCLSRHSLLCSSSLRIQWVESLSMFIS
jgi:hypothetical protein